MAKEIKVLSFVLNVLGLERVRKVARLIFTKLLYRVKYQNLQLLEQLGKNPYIIVCNHTTIWDPLFFEVLIPKLAVIGKQEIMINSNFAYTFFKWANVIPVDRKKCKPSTIKQAMSVLKSGQPLLIFPEGGCVKLDGSNRNYKGGAIFLALLCNVPIVVAHITPFQELFGHVVVDFKGIIWPEEFEVYKTNRALNKAPWLHIPLGTIKALVDAILGEESN